MTEPLYEVRMRGFELRALLYELPQMSSGLIAGCAAGYLYYFLFTSYPEWGKYVHLAIFGALAAVGIAGIFWGASYYPRRALLFDDRIRFIMAFSSREVPYAEIVSARTLDLEETRKTFLSLRYLSMSPSLSGAVELRRRNGRTWVFSAEDPEALVSQLNELVGKAKGAPAP